MDEIKGRKITFPEQDLGLLQCARIFATQDPSMPALNGVCVVGGEALSGDDIRIFGGRLSDAAAHDCVLPLFMLGLLTDRCVRSIRLGPRGAVAELPQGTLRQAAPEETAEGFPKKTMRKQFADASRYAVACELDSALLASRLNRLASYLAGVRRQEWVLRIAGREERVWLRCELPLGRFEESLKPLKLAGDFSIDLPLDLILEGLRRMLELDPVVRIAFLEKTPTLIETKRCKLLVARRVK